MEETLKKIVAKYLKKDASKIDSNASLKYDLCIDSLDLMGIVADVEKQYKVKLSLIKMAEIDTINDAVKYLEELTK